MSDKQHELNILNNVIEKSQGISPRLEAWAREIAETVQKEIAAELQENAPANPAAPAPGALATGNPLEGTDLNTGALVGGGAPEVDQSRAEGAAAAEGNGAPAPASNADGAAPLGAAEDAASAGGSAPAADPSTAKTE